MGLALRSKGQIFCSCHMERRTSIQSSAHQRRLDTFYTQPTALLCPLEKGKPLVMTSGFDSFSVLEIGLFTFICLADVFQQHENCCDAVCFGLILENAWMS